MVQVFRFTYLPSLVRFFLEFYHSEALTLIRTSFTDIYYDKNNSLLQQGATLRFREGAWCLKLQSGEIIKNNVEIAQRLQYLLKEKVQPQNLHPHYFFDSKDAICSMFTNRTTVMDQKTRAVWKLDAVSIPKLGWLAIGEMESSESVITSMSTRIASHIIRSDVTKIDLCLDPKFKQNEISDICNDPSLEFLHNLSKTHSTDYHVLLLDSSREVKTEFLIGQDLESKLSHTSRTEWKPELVPEEPFVDPFGDEEETPKTEWRPELVPEEPFVDPFREEEEAPKTEWKPELVAEEPFVDPFGDEEEAPKIEWKPELVPEELFVDPFGENKEELAEIEWNRSLEQTTSNVTTRW